jgi:hypothetical protein
MEECISTTNPPHPEINAQSFPPARALSPSPPCKALDYCSYFRSPTNYSSLASKRQAQAKILEPVRRRGERPPSETYSALREQIDYRLQNAVSDEVN